MKGREEVCTLPEPMKGREMAVFSLQRDEHGARMVEYFAVFLAKEDRREQPHSH
jgi:hypothetical protein